eukprot:Rmarinus@m.28234
MTLYKKNSLQAFFDSCKSLYRRRCKIHITGLDAAGKTSLLYKLNLGEVKTIVPTIGFCVETVDRRSVSLTAQDAGGRCPAVLYQLGRLRIKIRPLVRLFRQQCNALIWIIDANDRERFSDSIDELKRAIRDLEGTKTLEEAPVLIMLNKVDLPNAMRKDDALELHEFVSTVRGREVLIQETCMISGHGLYEGLDWLSSKVVDDSLYQVYLDSVRSVVSDLKSSVKKSWEWSRAKLWFAADADETTSQDTTSQNSGKGSISISLLSEPSTHADVVVADSGCAVEDEAAAPTAPVKIMSPPSLAMPAGTLEREDGHTSCSSSQGSISPTLPRSPREDPLAQIVLRSGLDIGSPSIEGLKGFHNTSTGTVSA